MHMILHISHDTHPSLHKYHMMSIYSTYIAISHCLHGMSSSIIIPPLDWHAFIDEDMPLLACPHPLSWGLFYTWYVLPMPFTLHVTWYLSIPPPVCIFPTCIFFDICEHLTCMLICGAFVPQYTYSSIPHRYYMVHVLPTYIPHDIRPICHIWRSLPVNGYLQPVPFTSHFSGTSFCDYLASGSIYAHISTVWPLCSLKVGG